MGPHSHGWWILLHVLLFVFWLGGDVSVFYASKYAVNPELGPQARGVAIKIMSGMDLLPKICLVLFLPSGVTLMALDRHGAELFGMPLFSWWQTVLVWVFALGWLWLAVTDHRRPGRFPLVHRADWGIRVALIAALAVVAGYTMLASRPFGVDTQPRWLGAKLAVYTLTIACGLGIRIALRPFGPAFARLTSEGSSPDVELALKRSINRCLPYVFTIWIGVVVAAALGLMKPGAHL